MKDNSLGTFWSPFIESDSNRSFVSGDHGVTGNALENRRKLATQLLEALDSSQQQHDEPYGAWLEEPMDLEVFGLSLAQSSPLQLDENEIFPVESPLDAEVPLSPIQPSSPDGLYQLQEDLIPTKISEPIEAAPLQNEELLESLEMLLDQIAEDDSLTPEQTEIIDEDDETAALLDSLINGDSTNSQDGNELDQFITLFAETETDQHTSPVDCRATSDSTISPKNIKSEPTDSEWLPSTSSGRKATPSRSTTTLRKTRKRAFKAEDRRQRKKEQNKTAATRYRLKKKAELDILLDEESELEKRNRQLQMKHDELANEVRYLKKLMLELFNSRNEKRR